MRKKRNIARMADTGITYIILIAVAFIFFSRACG